MSPPLVRPNKLRTAPPSERIQGVLPHRIQAGVAFMFAAIRDKTEPTLTPTRVARRTGGRQTGGEPEKASIRAILISETFPTCLAARGDATGGQHASRDMHAKSR